MLDDLKMIHYRDSKDMLGDAARQWNQLVYEFEVVRAAEGKQSTDTIKNIVYVGTDESALAAGIYKRTAAIDVPFEICRPDMLPRYVGAATLVICTDCPGQPAEVSAAVRWAAGRRARLAIFSADAGLIEFAKNNGCSFSMFPSNTGQMPVTLYYLNALRAFFQVAGQEPDGLGEPVRLAASLERRSADWLPTVPAVRNQAKQIALEIAGKSAVVVSGPLLQPAAVAWKAKINRNAKQVAWTSRYPEAAGNEFLGWTKQPVNKPYAVIDIRSDLDTASVRRQFELSRQMLSGLRPEPVIVQAQGDSLLGQLLHTLVLGDFASLYLALLAGNDPSSVDRLSKFNKEMS